jgi:hypothetical protein
LAVELLAESRKHCKDSSHRFLLHVLHGECEMPLPAAFSMRKPRRGKFTSLLPPLFLAHHGIRYDVLKNLIFPSKKHE